MAQSQKARAKALYDRRRAAGLCVRCGLPADGLSLCERHLAVSRDRLRARYGKLTEAYRIVSGK